MNSDTILVAILSLVLGGVIAAWAQEARWRRKAWRMRARFLEQAARIEALERIVGHQ